MVTRRISPVTYEIAVPRRRSKRMVTHINSLKVWNTPDASVLNLVVVGEEVEETQVDGVKLTKPTLDQTQQFEVGNMLEQYGEVICTKLGRATDTLSIWACLSLSGPAHTGWLQHGKRGCGRRFALL